MKASKIQVSDIRSIGVGGSITVELPSYLAVERKVLCLAIIDGLLEDCLDVGDVIRDAVDLPSLIHLMPDESLNPVLGYGVETAPAVVCLYASVGSLVASPGIRSLSCLSECLHETEERRLIFFLCSRTNLLQMFLH